MKFVQYVVFFIFEPLYLLFSRFCFWYSDFIDDIWEDVWIDFML